MPDSYFSIERKEPDNKLSPKSALTAVIEIMNFEAFLKPEKLSDLKSFYDELAQEIYYSKRLNYSHGLEVVKPEIRIISNRIYLFSFLHLEEKVPELSSMAFKLFVEYCNMVLALGLKHEMVIRGFAGPDKVIKTKVFSGSGNWMGKEDTLVLSDIIKVFPFDEIFPEGIDQVHIPAFELPVLHAGNFLNADILLNEIKAVGIYMPFEIQSLPSSELAVLSDLLKETSLNGKKIFVANWFNWADKHHQDFPVTEVRESIERLAKEKGSEYFLFWKNFHGIS